MDSSLHHDPFAPEGTTDVPDAIDLIFNETRWRNAGATDEQIVELREAFDADSEEERAGVNGWMKSVPDAALTSYLAELAGEPPETAQETSKAPAAPVPPETTAKTVGGPTAAAAPASPNDGQETTKPEG